MRARAAQLASFTHILDIPILMVIVSLGMLHASDWAHLAIGTALAVTVDAALNFFVQRLYPWVTT
jgi:hypothetical protein